VDELCRGCAQPAGRLAPLHFFCLFHNLPLKGHGFIRAAGRTTKSGALAPEGCFENCQQSVMKQLLACFQRAYQAVFPAALTRTYITGENNDSNLQEDEKYFILDGSVRLGLPSKRCRCASHECCLAR
jgi:hypothetical protein